MAKTPTDYYAKTTRSMLACVKEVGAMPFVLFQYYLTWEMAEFISPSLTMIAADLGILDKKGKPSKSAVSNLKKVLIDENWIEENNGQIVIKKFRFSEPSCSEKMNTKPQNRSEKMNEHSEFLNEPFRKNEQKFRNSESPLKEENKKELKENKNLEREEAHTSARELSIAESKRLNSLCEQKEITETTIPINHQIDDTLFWIRERKNLSKRNFDENAWVDFLICLEAEQITLDGFKEFYLWCENLDWVMRKKIAVSPKLMQNRIEEFKNREIFEAREKIANGNSLGKSNGNSNGIRLSEREKSAERITNTKAVIAELRRIGEAKANEAG